MFDNVLCECVLPLPYEQGELAGRNWRENVFQTKDFDCLMEDYRIREDRTLWQQVREWETTRAGLPRPKCRDWQSMNSYTGTVRFYDSICGTKADYWVEWVAVFVSGKITELKLHRWDECDNRERLAFEAQRKAEIQKRERFLATWFGRRVYPAYAWMLHGCFGWTTYRFFNSLARSFQRLGFWLNRMGDKLAPYGDPIRAEKHQRDWESWFTDQEPDE